MSKKGTRTCREHYKKYVYAVYKLQKVDFVLSYPFNKSPLDPSFLSLHTILWSLSGILINQAHVGFM